MAENRSFWSRRKRTLIVLGVVLVIALIVIFNLRSQREKTVKVTVAKVGKTDLTSIISASGEVKPKKNVEISALVPGRIIKIGVEEGDVVKAGDFLLKLDSTQYEAFAEGNRASIRSFRAQLIQDEAALPQGQERLRAAEKALRRTAHLHGPAGDRQAPVRRLDRPGPGASSPRSSTPRPRSRARWTI